MFSRIAILLICFLSLGGLPAVYPQVKITPATKSLPPDFKGVDPVVLAGNLKKLFAKNQASPNAGQKIYDDLTAGDLFAFIPEPSEWLSGASADASATVYRGQLFRLIHANEFPHPQTIEVKGCGDGYGIGSGRRYASREDLIADFNPLVSPESVWTQGMFHLRTIVPTDFNPQDYKGFSVDNCSGSRFFVPSTQEHYELAFVKRQPYRLLDVAHELFRFETYRKEKIKGAGIVVWKPDGGTYDEAAEMTPIFITRLVAPYLKTETLTRPDENENKTHSATRHKIYVELAEVWLVNRRTGEIISKNAADSKMPAANAAADLSYRTGIDLPAQTPVPTPAATQGVQILSKPRAAYPEAAKSVGIQGKVVLRVTFLADGTIGEISVISGLGSGVNSLTEQAIAAARQIKFKPARKNGVPVSTTKAVEYLFIPF